MDRETVTAQYFPPQVEMVTCVICLKQLAKHEAYSLKLEQTLHIPRSHIPQWVYNGTLGTREDGWRESFQYYYTDSASASVTHLLFTYRGHACSQAHAEAALELQPWNHVELKQYQEK